MECDGGRCVHYGLEIESERESLILLLLLLSGTLINNALMLVDSERESERYRGERDSKVKRIPMIR